MILSSGGRMVCINSFYYGALSAFIRMSEFLDKDVTEYKKLLKKGRKFTETGLFNGEYFIQKIEWRGLNAKDPTVAQSFHSSYSPEAKEILEKEGPKYQYGNGCRLMEFWGRGSPECVGWKKL